MSQIAFHVGRIRPPSLLAYEYLCGATKPDWAWEYLRRNVDYQASARLGHRKGVARRRLAAGPVLTRLRARHAGAEAWGLACFR
jgi:transcriptional regulator